MSAWEQLDSLISLDMVVICWADSCQGTLRAAWSSLGRRSHAAAISATVGGFPEAPAVRLSCAPLAPSWCVGPFGRGPGPPSPGGPPIVPSAVGRPAACLPGERDSSKPGGSSTSIVSSPLTRPWASGGGETFPPTLKRPCRPSAGRGRVLRPLRSVDLSPGGPGMRFCGDAVGVANAAVTNFTSASGVGSRSR